MSAEGIRIGVGTRVLHDGQLREVTELHPGSAGTEVVLGAYGRHSEVVRISLRELLDGHRARVCGEGSGPHSDDELEPADMVLSALSAPERETLQQRAGHIREVLTGYRCGTAEFAQPDEPRTGYWILRLFRAGVPGLGEPVFRCSVSHGGGIGGPRRVWVGPFVGPCHGDTASMKGVAFDGRLQTDPAATC